MSNTAEIWGKYNTLYKLAKSITKNDDDAHDLVMEVSLMLLDKTLAPDWYLYTVMRNEWFNKNSTFNKKYGRKEIDFVELELMQVESHLYQEQLEALRVAPLTDLEQKMLACYVECSYNASEVSRKYKISREVVNRIVHELKKKLRHEYNRIINNPE
jgi:RNA polymerase sigma factor (sigma-70 family)